MSDKSKKKLYAIMTICCLMLSTLINTQSTEYDKDYSIEVLSDDETNTIENF